MGFILSCTTTPKRIQNLIKTIPRIRCKYKYFVINICPEYKRFGKFKIPIELLKLCKTDKRIVFNFIDDYGAICKYIGGFRFMKKKQLTEDKLIIIDDDIEYHKDLFYELLDEKTKNNITTGSGFRYKNLMEYKGCSGDCDIVEGYAGVCFNYDQVDPFLEWFIHFYKHFIFKGDELIDKYLTGCFLGDDYVISDSYTDKWATSNGRQLVNPYQYGFGDDALQNNNVFGGNMENYGFLFDNHEVLETFKKKFNLNKEINNMFN
jgi:hypothetical protein